MPSIKILNAMRQHIEHRWPYGTMPQMLTISSRLIMSKQSHEQSIIVYKCISASTSFVFKEVFLLN